MEPKIPNIVGLIMVWPLTSSITRKTLKVKQFWPRRIFVWVASLNRSEKRLRVQQCVVYGTIFAIYGTIYAIYGTFYAIYGFINFIQKPIRLSKREYHLQGESKLWQCLLTTLWLAAMKRPLRSCNAKLNPLNFNFNPELKHLDWGKHVAYYWSKHEFINA